MIRKFTKEDLPTFGLPARTIFMPCLKIFELFERFVQERHAPTGNLTRVFYRDLAGG